VERRRGPSFYGADNISSDPVGSMADFSSRVPDFSYIIAEVHEVIYAFWMVVAESTTRGALEASFQKVVPGEYASVS